MTANITYQEGEFWSAKQRAGHSLHEISYRACFKPQLPAYFIDQYCQPGDVVYDPFMGRGTTLIEAQLHGCRAIGNDSNPLARKLAYPRLNPPSLAAIKKRMDLVTLSHPYTTIENAELLTFFHHDTLIELYDWRKYFEWQTLTGKYNNVDAWIEMVACNRLTGHSKGFFSVHTLPPNQAVTIEAQKRLNAKHKREPEYRNTKALILKKTKQLLRDSVPDHYRREDAIILTQTANSTSQLEIEDEFVDLVVTSPPFLDVVNYIQDNWLRMWFCRINSSDKYIWQIKNKRDWTDAMTAVFHELRRVLKPKGIIAFEVGEVRRQSVRLERCAIRAAMRAGLTVDYVLINTQDFTKTANCWGVFNNRKGTNSNRVVVLRKG